MTDSIVEDCLGRTCLKWSANGELTAVDLSLVMARLALVDRDVANLVQNDNTSLNRALHRIHMLVQDEQEPAGQMAGRAMARSAAAARGPAAMTARE